MCLVNRNDGSDTQGMVGSQSNRKSSRRPKGLQAAKRPWLRRRTQRRLLVGTLVGVLLIAAYSYFFYRSPAEQAKSIRENLLTATREVDVPLAELSVRQLDGLLATTDQDRWSLYEVYATQGNQSAAEALLNKLAPEDQAGFPLAHRQRAMQIADQYRLTITG